MCLYNYCRQTKPFLFILYWQLLLAPLLCTIWSDLVGNAQRKTSCWYENWSVLSSQTSFFQCGSGLYREVMGSRSWVCGRCLCSRRSSVFLPQQGLRSSEVLLSLLRHSDDTANERDIQLSNPSRLFLKNMFSKSMRVLENVDSYRKLSDVPCGLG